MPDTSPEHVLRVKQDATARLLALPGVVAVGIGPKIVGGEPTGQPAIRVFVRRKLSADQIPGDELIPPEIDGVVTDVALGGDPVLVADPPPVDAPGAIGVIDARNNPQRHARARMAPDESTQRPLVGGTQIMPVGSQWLGTLGCLVHKTGDPNVAYALTNMHVVQAPDLTAVTKNTTRIGQPAGDDSSSRCCSDVIGVWAGGGRARGRDEALVQLDAGQRWQARIEGVGVVAGMHPLTQADITGTEKYQVAKRGRTTKLTGGWVSAIAATTITPDNTIEDNLILVDPNPNPGASGDEIVFFDIEGDSGSALVNSANEVVGLVFARNDVGQGLAYQMQHVLERLAAEGLTVEVATATDPDEVHTVPGGSAVPLPPEMAARVATDPQEARAFLGTDGRAPVARPWFADLPPAAATTAAALADLTAAPAGRALLALWHEHREEVMRLLDRDRRVALVWYRGGGAALNQLLLRLPSHPERPLPDTLDGEPLMTTVDRVHAVFAARGSAALRAGLARARDLVPELGGRTYAEIVDALRAGELVHHE